MHPAQRASAPPSPTHQAQRDRRGRPPDASKRPARRTLDPHPTPACTKHRQPGQSAPPPHQPLAHTTRPNMPAQQPITGAASHRRRRNRRGHVSPNSRHKQATGQARATPTTRRDRHRPNQRHFARGRPAYKGTAGLRACAAFAHRPPLPCSSTLRPAGFLLAFAPGCQAGASAVAGALVS
jgi:hypothetical protein